MPQNLAVIAKGQGSRLIKPALHTSIFFGLLLVATNLLIAIINRRFWTWATIIALALLFTIGGIKDFEFSQWRTSLFMFASLTLTIFSKFAIESGIKMFTKWIDSGFVTH
jgi:hypothetical protein